ncbi:MAG TPA: RagB/SusD family nutrient uptake outer membrane protein [Prolixibacteraceae bacterium]|nr:RagB/SusD family nutrient uptake outer membrane protein [Prolixibacteraceae bacterium]
MKKIVTILTCAAVMLLSGSCEKYLDLEPQQSLDENAALSSDANVKTVMVGAYAVMRNSAIYGGCILRNAELLGAANEIAWQGTYNGPREIYNHQIIAANGDVTDQWIESYSCINICNNVLSALEVVKEDDRDAVEGQALFLRSLMYFDLVRFYAKPYEAGATNSQPGVPLVLTPTHGVSDANNVSRNTVDQVYAQVIKDLTTAASKLPEENGVYATSGAANALLARVYLQKGDFASARNAANTVIGSGVYELTETYEEAFNNEEYSSEDIFASKFTAQDGINQMTEFWSTTEYGGRDGDIEILEGHLNLYDPNDERLALFWEGNDGMRSGKWNTQYGLVNLIRLAEMYLIRAECNQRLGTAVGATPLSDYNTIHQRAGLPAKQAVTLSDILLERSLELAHEGFKIHDIRRLKLNTGTLTYKDPRLIFPIPEREISANPALKGQQNEGY